MEPRPPADLCNWVIGWARRWNRSVCSFSWFIKVVVSNKFLIVFTTFYIAPDNMHATDWLRKHVSWGPQQFSSHHLFDDVSYGSLEPVSVVTGVSQLYCMCLGTSGSIVYSTVELLHCLTWQYLKLTMANFTMSKLTSSVPYLNAMRVTSVKKLVELHCFRLECPTCPCTTQSSAVSHGFELNFCWMPCLYLFLSLALKVLYHGQEMVH